VQNVGLKVQSARFETEGSRSRVHDLEPVVGALCFGIVTSGRWVWVWDLGFKIWGFGIQGLGFGVQGLGFGVWGLGFGDGDLCSVERLSLKSLIENQLCTVEDQTLGLDVLGVGHSVRG
jgi:hypothetical protein